MICKEFNKKMKFKKYSLDKNDCCIQIINETFNSTKAITLVNKTSNIDSSSQVLASLVIASHAAYD